MPEIKHRQENASPEIEYAEIYIPDDRVLGTGSFKTVIKPGGLSKKKVVSSIMINVPAFQISINFNPPTREIPVLLGFANGSDPISRKVYLFPENMSVSDSHEFEVTFKNWGITGLFMDKVSLGLKEDLSHGIVTEGLLPPGAPIPEHIGTLQLTLPRHDFPQEVKDRILANIFDLSKNYTFYQTKQGNTELHIYRNMDFQFVYRHYNPTFGEREIRIDFADAEREGAKAFFIIATWSVEKNSFHVGLIHTDPKFEPLRDAFVLSKDKLRLIRENIEALEEIVNTPRKEEEAHQFLKNNSILLGLTSDIEPKSKFKLGDDYETDFVIHEIPDGFIFVEIERPGIQLFKKGKENRPPERMQDFNHAIEQIENWRAWVSRNHSYIASKLEDISPNPLCWLIAGRRTKLSRREMIRLAEINEEHKNAYKIFTYDDLIDRIKAVISKMD